MTMVDHALRARISGAVTEALRPVPEVFAGWEGGSAAFGTVDAFSDIDLEFLVDDDASFADLYVLAERGLESVSPITASHTPLQGRYYKLKDGGDFLLLDLMFHRVGAPDRHLDIERHGEKVPLFDKGDWLRPTPLDERALAMRRDRRYRELQTWFSMSQVCPQGHSARPARRSRECFLGRHVEAIGRSLAHALLPRALGLWRAVPRSRSPSGCVRASPGSRACQGS